MSRLAETFERLRMGGERGLIPYLTAGDPNLATTGALLATLAEAGADVIELGVPFSDPMADGPVIQRASERALRQGVGLRDIFDLVATFRERFQTPIVLFGYYNPLLRFGLEPLARRCADVGVDALLVVDLPPEEAAPLRTALAPHRIDLITLLAPTSDAQRIEAARTVASGFVYYVSLTGVTGAALGDTADIGARVEQLRVALGLPVAVGFGIATPEQARAVGAHADAVVVGSALVRIIEEYGTAPDLLDAVGRFVGMLKDSLRGLPRPAAHTSSEHEEGELT